MLYLNLNELTNIRFGNLLNGLNRLSGLNGKQFCALQTKCIYTIKTDLMFYTSNGSTYSLITGFELRVFTSTFAFSGEPTNSDTFTY